MWTLATTPAVHMATAVDGQLPAAAIQIAIYLVTAVVTLLTRALKVSNAFYNFFLPLTFFLIDHD